VRETAWHEATVLTDAQLACVDTISPARFADVVTAETAAKLSDAEVAAENCGKAKTP
jgi:hypothetical protein